MWLIGKQSWTFDNGAKVVAETQAFNGRYISYPPLKRVYLCSVLIVLLPVLAGELFAENKLRSSGWDLHETVIDETVTAWTSGRENTNIRITSQPSGVLADFSSTVNKERDFKRSCFLKKITEYKKKSFSLYRFLKNPDLIISS